MFGTKELPHHEKKRVMNRLFLALFLGLALLLTSCQVLSGAPPYTETSFTVTPGEKHTVAVELRAGSTLDGSFSISGGENYIDFYIKGPEGGLAYGVVRAVGGQSFETTAQLSGTHTMYFDNSFSFGSPRQISLRYRSR